MGEPRLLRPAVVAAEAGAHWWDVAVQTARATPRGAVDHTDLYDLAVELVDTVRALEALTGVLAQQTQAYAERGDLRDDEDIDPASRLEQAALEALAASRLLGAALRPANDFWSAVGHIGLRLDPPQHQQDAEHNAEQDHE